MERLVMLYLLLSSALLSITACSAMKHGEATQVQKNCLAQAHHRVSSANYNTQIDFWGKHFSGIMVFKSTSDTSERCIFMSETGFKFFDFEFTPHQFSVKYCLPGLNKKFIIKTLQRDLGYLSDFGQLKITGVKQTADSCLNYACKTGANQFDYYTTNSSCTLVKRIEHGNEIYRSLVIDFDGIKNDNFAIVKMSDHKAHLKILMQQIEK